MANNKKYQCNKCGRSINHKGNCLKCNLIAKREREKKVPIETPGFVDILVSQILKIELTDHKKIQSQLLNIFRKQGYFVELEKKIQARRPGRIDLFAKKDDFSFGIEIDHSLIRLKSIDKLNKLKPNLAIFILKSRKINKISLHSRFSLIKVKSLIVYLLEKKYKIIN